MKEIRNSDRYMSNLTIDAKVQIVIPKEVVDRGMFAVYNGSTIQWRYAQ